MADYDFGPKIKADSTSFRFWCPKFDRVFLVIDGAEPLRMTADGNGWHHHDVEGVLPGARYWFRLPDGLEVPDPASRHQPEDVHGPSELVDLAAYRWQTPDWRGRAWEETVIYELHVGTFTPKGTFRAAIGKLDHLRDLGITAIQLMPIADFPGRYGWGYDGVLPYAPESSYGRPEDLMALVDAAHARGISVFLDVVYNHFGPDGNYLAAYAPLFSDRHKTPWGNGINYDGEASRPVREFVIQNALYWIDRFRFDGLRLDAVHGIVDDSAEHLLHELARRVREAAGDRHVHLIVENEENDASLLVRDERGHPRHFTAQWNDDIHHVLHVATTGETFGYYGDYVADPDNLERALAEGFVFQGQLMPYRGEARGQPSAHLPPTTFISFIQNHDQIGNRAIGDRMAAGHPPEPLKAIAAVCLLAPQIPMLFMGEEWGAKTPFPYFCDFNEELNEKVREGRRKELARLPGFDADDAIDPTSEDTFRAAKLDWNFDSTGQDMIAFYRELLAIRAREIVPRLKGIKGNSAHYEAGAPITVVRWTLRDGARLSLAANLTGRSVVATASANGRPIFTLGQVEPGAIGPWSVVWAIEDEPVG